MKLIKHTKELNQNFIILNPFPSHLIGIVTSLNPHVSPVRAQSTSLFSNINSISTYGQTQILLCDVVHVPGLQLEHVVVAGQCKGPATQKNIILHHKI